MITELSKCEFFTVESIEVSTHERNMNHVLRVRGALENNGLTIRKKKPVFTEEEKKIRSERAKIYLHKKQKD